MFNTIPTINLQALSQNSVEGFFEVSKRLEADFARYGFAYLINHGISKDLIDTTLQEAIRFHALPLEEKLKITHTDACRGYTPNKTSQIKYSTEGVALKPNVMDSFVMMFESDPSSYEYQHNMNLHGANQWPGNLPGFKENVCAYRDSILDLAQKLLKSFSLAFNTNYEEFESLFDNPTYFLRLQHYEPQNINDTDQFGLAPHTDAGFFTIIAQDEVSGLEVKTNDGKWITVPRIYSIPFFFDPNMNATIKVIGSYKTNDQDNNNLSYKEHIVTRVQKHFGVGKLG
ncbi:MAG: efe [Burkholderiales bacterium]|jgi:isopenicillin N synthase-like dioxygenase|nr:efe [Burkholderiales bacterium]